MRASTSRNQSNRSNEQRGDGVLRPLRADRVLGVGGQLALGDRLVARLLGQQGPRLGGRRGADDPVRALRLVRLAGRREVSYQVVAPRGQGMFPASEGNLFRGEGAPFAPGDTVQVPGMRATVLEVGEAGPLRMRFEFDDPLESPSRVWINDRFRGLEDATPPDPGFGNGTLYYPPLGPPGADRWLRQFRIRR